MLKTRFNYANWCRQVAGQQLNIAPPVARTFWLFLGLLTLLPCSAKTDPQNEFYSFVYMQKGESARLSLLRVYKTFANAIPTQRKELLQGGYSALVNDPDSRNALELDKLAEYTAHILQIANFPTVKCLHYLYLTAPSNNQGHVEKMQGRVNALAGCSALMERLTPLLEKGDHILREGVFRFYSREEVLPEEDEIKEVQALRAIQSIFTHSAWMPRFVQDQLFKRTKHDDTQATGWGSNIGMWFLRFTAVEGFLWVVGIYLWRTGDTCWRLVSWGWDWLKYLKDATLATPALPRYVLVNADAEKAAYENSYVYQAGQYVMRGADKALELLLGQPLQTGFHALYKNSLGPWVVGGLWYVLYATWQVFMIPIGELTTLWSRLKGLYELYWMLLTAANYLTTQLHHIADTERLLKRVERLLTADSEVATQFARHLQPIQYFLTSKKTAFLRSLLEDIRDLPRKQLVIWDILWPWTTLASDLLAYYKELCEDVSTEAHDAFKEALYATCCVLVETAYARHLVKSTQGKTHTPIANVKFVPFVPGERPNIQGQQLYIPLAPRMESTRNDIDFKEAKNIIQGKNGSGKKTYTQIAAWNLVLSQSVGWVLGAGATVTMADSLLFILGPSDSDSNIRYMAKAINAAKSNTKVMIFCNDPFQTTYAPEGTALTVSCCEEVGQNRHATLIVTSHFLAMEDIIAQQQYLGYYFITIKDYIGQPGKVEGPIALEFTEKRGLPRSVLARTRGILRTMRRYKFREAL